MSYNDAPTSADYAWSAAQDAQRDNQTLAWELEALRRRVWALEKMLLSPETQVEYLREWPRMPSTKWRWQVRRVDTGGLVATSGWFSTRESAEIDYEDKFK